MVLSPGEKIIPPKFVIGALHFMPLEGYNGFSSYDEVLQKALLDLRAFEEGGVDGVIVENNYDLPHQIKETPAAIEMMRRLTLELSKSTHLPLAVSVLWNDFESALSIASESKALAVRVPVFVDSVSTAFGTIIANPVAVKTSQEKCGSKVAIWADIHVKHATMLDPAKTLEKSAIEAKQKGADAIIITGKWTGDAPILNDLMIARKTVGKDFPIIVGSGADQENISTLLDIADGVIVSTALKEGEVKTAAEERNLKPYDAKMSVSKIKSFMNEVNKKREKI